MLNAAVLALIAAATFVNGWTDAPNAIACAVSTGAMSYRSAAWAAGVCNLLGLLAMRLAGAPVANTIASLADFGTDSRAALIALCAAMASIVIFAAAAWFFGVPTSESHALIAALTGAALALGGAGGVSVRAWGKVLAGLGLSLALGYGLGFLGFRMLGKALGRLPASALGSMQALAACGMAFMHGAQDGQKFVAVFVMAELLVKGEYAAGPVDLSGHTPVLALCAMIMALGTSVGGGRIIELVGGKMVRLDKREGVCADLGGALCLLAASLLGIPMSTSHAKTTAMMGAAGAAHAGRVDKKVAGGVALTWVVTFPVCGALGWAVTLMMLRFF